jgi:hypothetical protein
MAGPVYTRRQPEKTALFQVVQQHLLTFEQEWTDKSDGRTLPKFVLDELHGFMACGVLGRGLAHLYCDACREHHVVAFSCKARAVCPSCLGRRMNEGALNLVDHVLPDVPLRQFVFTVAFPLRFPLAFDGALLGQVVRIFVDTVDGWYRRRHVERGLPPGETGAVAVIQRANSDLRLNPHIHAVCLDGVYSADREGARNARGVGRGRCGPEVPEGGEGKGLMFHPAPAPSQEEIESLVGRASKRILRFLQRRKVITLVTAPGDGEVTVVGDETMGEKDPLLARLLAAAAAGAAPAGPANQRKPLRIVLDPDERPVGKGTLCAQTQGFNLHAATKVAANDTQGRLALCKYILRPPLANDRLKILDDGNVRLQLKKPWSDGTSSVDLEPLALIARLAALVPPPKRHLTRYFGVLSSHAASRSEVVPTPTEPTPTDEKAKPKSAGKSKYIPWHELLRKTFGFEVVCQKCQSPLRLIALIKTEDVAKKILTAMHLPTDVPQLHPARPPPRKEEGGDDDCVN